MQSEKATDYGAGFEMVFVTRCEMSTAWTDPSRGATGG
jgi:hypothetical protein